MKTKIKDLSAACINEKPRDYDWSQGWGEHWDFNEAVECSCGSILTASGHSECEKCESEVLADGPMMNYFYPCDRITFDDAEKLKDLPLCIVCLDNEEYGLALTGGGMDLSWEICEAYILLGYLPPIHFCDLPAMAGKKLNARNKRIIAACRRSLRTEIQWNRQKLKSFKYLVGQLA